MWFVIAWYLGFIASLVGALLYGCCVWNLCLCLAVFLGFGCLLDCGGLRLLFVVGCFELCIVVFVVVWI